MLNVNTILQNRYQIIRLLGAGGMGAVYLARHLALNQNVALKECYSTDVAAATQFQTEATILARLSHPNLPRVTDFFVETNGMRYLVMDYIEGQDLDQLIQQRGALVEQESLTWMHQIFNAAQYLHENRVIHRDIKPQNIIITPQGKAMLVDFGIAKIIVTGRHTISGAQGMVSPGYASPEHYSGGTDERSDVYALGATLYFILTGQSPADAPRRAAGAHLVPAQQINPSITSSTATVIETALNLIAAYRFKSVSEMQDALDAVHSPIQMSPTLPVVSNKLDSCVLTFPAQV